ncbi:MAG: hypothetical protein ACE5DS_00095 [Kiloniellaceae bacterium]
MRTRGISLGSTVGRGATAWIACIALVLGTFLFAFHLPSVCAPSADCAAIAAPDTASGVNSGGGDTGDHGQTYHVPDCATHGGCSVVATVANRHPAMSTQGESAAMPVTKLALAGPANRPAAPPP